MDTPEHMWPTAASLHMEGNAEKWLHMYKKKHGLGNWDQFMEAVQQKFGVYEYKHAVDDLLELKQSGTVEEYVDLFESLQYQIEMHDQRMGDTYFISQFIKGLKPEMRYQVQGQVPATMERAIMLAKIQQQIQEKSRSRPPRSYTGNRLTAIAHQKAETIKPNFVSQLPRERQLRDFCRANNLCFYCKEPYDPTHAAKCTKRPQAQVNALVVNDLDTELTEEVLQELAVEDVMAKEFCGLSINALAGTEEGEAMRMRALVQNKVMLILVDSGSSHTFVRSSFLTKLGIHAKPTTPRQVKVANGEVLITDHYVPKLEW
jgi:hypothetical protein